MKGFSVAINAVLAATIWAGNALAQFDFKAGGSVYGSLSDSVVPIPPKPDSSAAKSENAAAKKWTVMVFMNAKNDLEASALYNFNQMELTGSTNDVNVVVELGRIAGQTGGADGGWTGSKRFLITKDADGKKINSPAVMADAKADMGDYKRVVDFVVWAKKAYPARRYMLIIWNHGSGWMDPRKSQKGISFDDETGNYIRTPQLGLILKEAGKVDILAFDACLMQMAEVAYEVKDNAEVVIGSEETVPGGGYPYNIILPSMNWYPDHSTEEIAASIVDAFKIHYDGHGRKEGAQLSAIRTSKLPGLAARVSDFAGLAEAVSDTESLKAARDGVIRYDYLDEKSDPQMTNAVYGDLSQFARLLAVNMKSDNEKAPALMVKAADLQAYIDRELVIASKASFSNRLGRDLSESRGLSIYLPPMDTSITQQRLEKIFEGKYTDLAFDKAAGWYKFVTFLYGIK